MGGFPGGQMPGAMGQQAASGQNAAPPENTSDNQPMFDRENMQFPGQPAPQNDSSSLMLSGVSAIVLALGLLMAWRYKR